MDTNENKASLVTLSAIVLIEVLKSIANFRIYDPNAFEYAIKRFVDTLNAINSLPEDVERLGIYDLSEYQIVSDFAFLLLPKQLKFVDSRAFKDLVVRPTLRSEMEVESPADFIATQSYICSVMRIRNLTMSKVVEHRNSLIFSDEIARNLLSDGVQAVYSDGLQPPIVVAPDIISNAWKYPLFNIPYDEYCRDILRRNFAKLSGVIGG